MGCERTVCAMICRSCIGVSERSSKKMMAWNKQELSSGTLCKVAAVGMSLSSSSLLLFLLLLMLLPLFSLVSRNPQISHCERAREFSNVQSAHAHVDDDTLGSEDLVTECIRALVVLLVLPTPLLLEEMVRCCPHISQRSRIREFAKVQAEQTHADAAFL